MPGSAAAVATLLGRGENVVFCTNNSTTAGSDVAARLEEQGIPSGARVVTSADALCTLIEPGERVLVLGSPGLTRAIRDRGAQAERTLDAVGSLGVDSRVSARGRYDSVVVGLTRAFDYAQLDLASWVVRDGARLLATNSDATFPAQDRVQPGTGALLAALEAASGVSATIAGKPEMAMARLIEAELGTQSAGVVVVGDRPGTDGRLAQRMDRPFVLVLSGVTASAPESPEVPIAVVTSDLASLVAGDLLEGTTGMLDGTATPE